MRQVRIRVTCDACAAWKDRDVDAGVETVPVVAGHTLDLCADHRTGMGAVLALIAEWAAPPETGRKRASEAPTQAPLPVAGALNGNAPSKRGGKRARARRANAAAAAADTSQLQATCPLCQHPAPTADALGHHVRGAHGTSLMALYGGVCPVCAHDGHPRGMGTHGAKAHGVNGTPYLFALAQQQGDPHGVIAQRAAAVAAS